MASFIWYELMTTDTKAAQGFYSSVVGWSPRAFEGGQDYTVLHAGEAGVGGVMESPPGMPAFWIGYIHAPDVDAALSGDAATKKEAA